MLAMGSSRPWPDALEAMTGHRKLDASAILEYFKPLDDWLIKTNKALGVGVGWKSSDSEKANSIISFAKRRDYISKLASFQKSIAQSDDPKRKITVAHKRNFPKSE